MTDYPSVLVNDGRGGQIPFPPFIGQREMDIVTNQFVVQDEDVFVVTYPRSGTTWTEQIVHLLVNQGEQGDQRLTDAVPWVETLPNRPGGLGSFLQTMNGRRLFTSHLPYSLMPKGIGTTARYIYVARNPKDVAVSYYYHDCSKAGYTGSWKEHFQLFVQGRVTFGSYFDHVLPWWEASRHVGNILFLKYEDMKRDLAAIVNQIAVFIGVTATPDLVDGVVAHSRFDVMAAKATTNFAWIPQRAGVPKHYRRGVVGDWRNHFDAEQDRQIEALIQERMAGTGLRFDFGQGLVLP